jgi:pyruvate dehydrogenase E1 component
LSGDKEERIPFISELLSGHDGPIVAVSDWMKLVPEQLRPYLNQDFFTLGTDGWGVSDTRGALRRHFLIDAESIVVQCLSALSKNGEIKNKTIKEAIIRYKLNDPSAADPGSAAGDS